MCPAEFFLKLCDNAVNIICDSHLYEELDLDYVTRWKGEKVRDFTNTKNLRELEMRYMTKIQQNGIAKTYVKFQLGLLKSWLPLFGM